MTAHRPPINASHMAPSLSKNKPINLLRGWPAPSLLPAAAIQQASAEVLSDPEIAVPALQYGADPGFMPLRQSLASWLGEFYGPFIDTDAGQSANGSAAVEGEGGGEWETLVDRICITGGASQSIACILQSYTDPSYTRAIWMVAPCYFLACPIFADAGFAGRLRSVPEDEEGISVEYLEGKLKEMEEGRGYGGDANSRPLYKDPKPYRKIYRHIIYCVPSFSNPSGKTMTLQRRKSLVELARKYDALVICDDVYDMLQWHADPAPSNKPNSNPVETSKPSVPDLSHALLPRLPDLDLPLGPSPHDPPGQHFGHAVSNGSFSKLVGPGMRTGWTYSSAALCQGLSQTGSTRSGGAPSQLSAATLDRMLRAGALTAHVRDALVPTYRRRHALLADAVARVLAPLLAGGHDGAAAAADTGDLLRSSCADPDLAGVAGGYFVWMRIPDSAGLRATARQIAERCQHDENLAIGHGALFEVQGDEGGIKFDREIRLCFSWVAEEDLVEGVARLGKVIRRMIREEEEGSTPREGPQSGISGGQGEAAVDQWK